MGGTSPHKPHLFLFRAVGPAGTCVGSSGLWVAEGRDGTPQPCVSPTHTAPPQPATGPLRPWLPTSPPQVPACASSSGGGDRWVVLSPYRRSGARFWPQTLGSVLSAAPTTVGPKTLSQGARVSPWDWGLLPAAPSLP